MTGPLTYALLVAAAVWAAHHLWRWARLLLLAVAWGWVTTPTEAGRWAWRAMIEGRGGDE